MSSNERTYRGSLLRVDLTRRQLDREEVTEAVLRQYVGGTGLGAIYLFNEVPRAIDWSHPDNRLILAAGPLSGTAIHGSGSFSVVTKGPLTGGASSTQANGYLGTSMRSSGFDALLFQGASDDWVYLYVHDGQAKLMDARYLLGRDTWETEEAIARELGLPQRSLSIFSIGPAGENLVKLAAIVGDRGHVAAHNGVGAVMGSKKLKAVVAARGRGRVSVRDPSRLSALAGEIHEGVMQGPMGQMINKWGTSHLFTGYEVSGVLPVRNLTTNSFPEHDRFDGENYRPRLRMKPMPCWTCRHHHCHIVTVTEGPYKGYVGEEPEYEGMAAFSSLLGQTDLGAAIMLNDVNDRLGMDANEMGWLLAMAFECYERGIITRKDTGGIELTWGNAEAARAMLHDIARRRGFGDTLAEGVMRAARIIGGEAPDIGVYLKKGLAPRGHDHRARWIEILDVATSNVGTIESANVFVRPEEAGLPSVTDTFDPEQVALTLAGTKGRRFFEDSLVICTIASIHAPLKLFTDALNAATGWDWTPDEVWPYGQHLSNLLRVFDLRQGLGPESEAPSLRYSSAPVDGPIREKTIAPHWDRMRRSYYDHMGWDPETGKPLPETLKKVGLGHIEL